MSSIVPSADSETKAGRAASGASSLANSASISSGVTLGSRVIVQSGSCLRHLRRRSRNRRSSIARGRSHPVPMPRSVDGDIREPSRSDDGHPRSRSVCSPENPAIARFWSNPSGEPGDSPLPPDPWPGRSRHPRALSPTTSQARFRDLHKAETRSTDSPPRHATASNDRLSDPPGSFHAAGRPEPRRTTRASYSSRASSPKKPTRSRVSPDGAV